jgi:hypothetical protein
VLDAFDDLNVNTGYDFHGNILGQSRRRQPNPIVNCGGNIAPAGLQIIADCAFPGKEACIVDPLFAARLTHRRTRRDVFAIHPRLPRRFSVSSRSVLGGPVR